jgi:hypothetical protein
VYSRGEHDADGDGKLDVIDFFVRGVIDHTDHLQGNGITVAKREHYRGGFPASAEYDADGDGVFEKRVEFDRFGEPK